MVKKTYKISIGHRKVPHEIYHKKRAHFERLAGLIEEIKRKEDISSEEILSILARKEELLAAPVSIFSSWLGPLESLVKFMKENMKLSFAEISRITNRDQRTIWITYNNCRKKNLEIPILNEHFIPLDIFANRQLSILENLAAYMHEQLGHPLRDIAKLTKKDSRTIWTVYHRAKKKRK